PDESYLFAFDFGVTGNRQLTTASERTQERSFGAASQSRVQVIGWCTNLIRLFVITPRLQTDCSLSHGGHHLRMVDHFANPVRESKPSQTGGSKNQRVILPFIKLTQTRINIAS